MSRSPKLPKNPYFSVQGHPRSLNSVTIEGNDKVRGARCEEGKVRASVQGIRAKNEVISKAVCEAVVLCAIGKRA